MSFDYFEHLSSKHTKNIKSHKYTTNGKSLLEPLLSGWWEFVIKYTPRTISPNALTSIGLLCVVSSTFLLSYFSPKMDKPIPSWVNIYAALCLFIYQTLDAIDGKQARRLNCSSALGEFFDHGCDAMTTFLILINIGCAAQASYNMPYFKMGYWVLLLSLYCTHWVYFVTGSFYFTAFLIYR
ncbi:hypothetical protein MXB_279 [Myxobolus squamalis]|nr:hypothetical protein MXB_279 [Myxobolus squamalis]